MAKRNQEERGGQPRGRTIIQRVVVPVGRAYERTKRKADGMTGTTALKFLAASALGGVVGHVAQSQIKKFAGHVDPLWVSTPMTAAAILAATQLEGYWQAGAFGMSVDSVAQLGGDAYRHFKKPDTQEQSQQRLPSASANAAKLGAAAQSAASLLGEPQAVRNATPADMSAAYDAARRELAFQQQQTAALQQQQAQQQQAAAMQAAGFIPYPIY